VSAHCLFCGGAVGASGACEGCGTYRRTVDEKRIGAPCPRCAGVHLGPVEIGAVVVQGCARCRGVFLTAIEWDAILEMTARSRVPAPVALAPAPPPPVEFGAKESADSHPYRGEISSAVAERIEEIAPEIDREAPVRCPVCSAVAERVEFAFFSRISVDVCRLHGLWLDGGELAQVVERAKAPPMLTDADWRPSEPELQAYELVDPTRDVISLPELVLRTIARILWRRPE